MPDEAGQSEYPTRLRGMIAGLEIYKASYDKSDGLVIVSLGLDENDWRVQFENGQIVATYLQDEDISMQADDSSTKWTLFEGDEIIGSYGKARDAAAAAVERRRPATGPSMSP